MFRMTPNIMRNLAVRKSTRRYPAEVREPFAHVRGELINDIERCIFCGTCEVKCPSQCIQVDKKACLWTYDPFACVYCGVCSDTCPAKSLYQKTQYRSPIGERLIITLQGQPRKKDKVKDPAREAGAPRDPGEEKADPGSTAPT
ncbi:MAG: 4Fe-4S binding protein [Desulfobacterales bacterium]|jgi:ech hydrogenase subunit F|nr:4Fe-4S binding protein [Desulfobacterales bacterium]